MKVAIVGHEAAKFRAATEQQARTVIRQLLEPGSILVSGHCHLGGVDIYAEEEAAHLDIESEIYPPKRLSWNGGYKPRNLQIAGACDVAHCIVVANYPRDYNQPRYGAKKDGTPYCYHCHDNRPTHVKSGGCWTLLQAEKQGKPTYWHIIEP